MGLKLKWSSSGLLIRRKWVRSPPVPLMVDDDSQYVKFYCKKHNKHILQFKSQQTFCWDCSYENNKEVCHEQGKQREHRENEEAVPDR